MVAFPLIPTLANVVAPPTCNEAEMFALTALIDHRLVALPRDNPLAVGIIYPDTEVFPSDVNDPFATIVPLNTALEDTIRSADEAILPPRRVPVAMRVFDPKEPRS
jgi:hypothetical protein